MRASLRGVHRTVTSAGLWLRPFCGARLRPASKSSPALLCALPLGGEHPRTEVSAGGRRKMHFLDFSKDDYNCQVELALTSDGRTVVCYHPPVDIPYEHTKPIPRPDPVHNYEETQDQILKTRLEEKDEHFEQGPTLEQLSKMFFSTKHRWYPYGQYHTHRRKLNPPKDR